MKKVFILASLLLVMASSVFAEQWGFFMEFHRKINPEKNMEVNRAPMRIPIEAIYDSDKHTIEIIGNELIDAEVFLYDGNNILVDHSSSLNTVFNVSNPGTYTIQIQGDGWYAEGNIEI